MLHTIYKQDLEKLPIKDAVNRKALTLKFMQGANAIFKVRRVRPYAPFVPVLAQIPVFLLFASEIRGMVSGIDLGSSVAAAEIAAALPDTGILWFTDLSQGDR
jgi:hypothetical protein